MKKKIVALALALCMVLTGLGQSVAVNAAEAWDTETATVADCEYDVITPSDYETSGKTYPVVYVMPEDGYNKDESGLTEKLQDAMGNGIAMDMIIVRPSFAEGTDVRDVMAQIVDAVDAEYNTIVDAENRLIVGTGVGGYLAYIVAMTKDAGEDATLLDQMATDVQDFYYVASIRGDFVSEANPWYATYGDVLELLDAYNVKVAEVRTATTEAVNAEVATEAKKAEFLEEAKKVVSEDEANKDKTEAEIQELVEAKAEELSAKYVRDTVNAAVGEVPVPATLYTYLDAPVTDTYTNMEGSTNDIGAFFINEGKASNVHEFTVRLGSFTDEFMAESANRITDRMTQQVLSGLVTGSVSLENAALTKDVEKAKVSYSIDVKAGEEKEYWPGYPQYGTYYAPGFDKYASTEQDIEVVVSVVDTTNNATGPQVLDEVSVDAKVVAGQKVEGTLEVANKVNGSSVTVQLSVRVLGTELVLDTTTLARIHDTVVEEEVQYLDLMGDWYFHYTGSYERIDINALLESEEYKDWSVVQPAITSWTKGFGDVTSRFPGDYFDYGIYGDGYYVRTFDVPEGFTAEEMILSVGYMDDRGEVFINGTRVGATGMNEDGVATGDTAWAVYSYYEIDPSVLNIGGTNTIVVRCENDGMGGGGWYGGPVALYSKYAFENDESTKSLFTEYVFDSEYAASAQGKEGTVENKFLVYLPEGYYETDKHYPTVYLMHQYNSDHTSYIIDDVDTLINEAIKQALLDEMIVVVPNSAESSWWRGDWMKMVTEELIPLIDSEYRTINDARYRFTAGCSMGGQGAFGVALTNPDLFSGAISFFGAFSMGGNASPLYVAANESAEYMDYFSMYFICGNQDVYGFGDPAIELNQMLEEMGVDHEFFIENGEHNSVFYLPHFIEAMVYTRNNMYQSDDAVEDLLTGAITIDTSNNGLIVNYAFEALAGIEEYFNIIPDSSYTKDTTPVLSVPLTVEIIQGGQVVAYAESVDNHVAVGNYTELYVADFTGLVDTTEDYEIVLKASIFDRVVELDKKVVDVETDKDEVTSPSTGEVTSVYFYLTVAALVVLVASKKRRFN